MRKFNENYALSRIIHAIPGLQNIDIYLNGKLFFNDIDFTNFTPYVYIPEGEYILEVFRKDEKENPLVKDILRFEKDELSSVAIVGDLEKIEILKIKEDKKKPRKDKVKARFIHLVPNGRKVNLLLDENTVAYNVSYKEATHYADFEPKTYSAEIELSENNQLLRKLRITMRANKVYSLYAIGEKPNFQIFMSPDGSSFNE